MEKKYVVEGDKMATEYLAKPESIVELYATADWLDTHKGLWQQHTHILINTCEPHELKKISSLHTAPNVLLICLLPPYIEHAISGNNVLLALDNIQDPGNMGTIIRTADWMGVHHIICNSGCVDIYNPKVVQATMGSLLRVNVQETELEDYFKTNSLPVYGAVLDGLNVFDTSFQKPCVLLIGNEGSGIQPSLIPYIQHKITIPSKGSAESLNAAMATGILLGLCCLK